MSFIFGRPKMPVPAPLATRDDAAAEAATQDKLSRRRGAAANQLVNGAAGAEAPATGARAMMGY